MKKTSDLQLNKVFAASVFIFLTGIFAGLFFSTGLSEENSEYLSSLLLSSINDSSSGLISSFLSGLVSNFTLVFLMLASVLTRLLCPLPFALLIYKSFSTGFCSGILHLNHAKGAFIVSLTEIVLPSALILGGFIFLAAISFVYSKEELIKTKRSFRDKKDLKVIMFISLAAITIGCLAGAI